MTEKQDSVCRNVFKNGEGEVNAQIVTAVWIELINRMEQSKALLLIQR